MPGAPEVLRVFLAVCIVGMAALAVAYLRKRDMPLDEYLGWGLLILLLPILGPFLEIFLRPGKPRS